ncbi:MAG TPA: hypothetical protein VE377_00045 [Candidatus Dormibacteraeota bacterium]|nr:hypothetical protein [Candidatus Dormibacteraeota bacterium]
MPISAVDTITLAFQHTKRQLLQPFRFWQWTRLAIVGLLAGEMGSGGSFNFPTNFNIPRDSGSSRNLLAARLPKIDPAILGAVIVVLIVAGLTFAVVMTYISSVMRFILFDSVLTRECHIRAGWARRQDPGWKFFLWQLGYMLVMLAGMAVLLGVPAALAYSVGWFSAPSEHLLALVLGGMVVFCLLVIFLVAAAVVHVLTKDFVVPQMALEGIGAIEGWRRLWPMLQTEKQGYAIYVGMKIVLAIGAGIAIGIASLLLGLIIAVPAIGVAIAAAVAGKTTGMTWNVFTITGAIVGGCILLAVFLYVIALVSVPATVFFPAYSLYFFAPRYRALSLALYPPPPGSTTGSPPQDLPPSPAPQPAG